MKRPAFQWYPGDWQRDLALQACSFEARSLWREMLDRMHDGDPYGHLTAGGVPISPADLARLIGKPAAVVRRWLDELEARKVFSRTDDGIIYSRRMVRDERVRNARAAGGAKSLENENVPRPKPLPKDDEKDDSKDTLAPSLGGSPSTATTTAVSTATSQQVLAAAQVLSIAANRGLAAHVDRPQPIPRIMPAAGRSIETAEALLAAGVPLDFAESHVYELAKSHAAEGAVTSLKYFRDAVIRAWDEHQASESANGKPRRRPASRPSAGGGARNDAAIDGWYAEREAHHHGK